MHLKLTLRLCRMLWLQLHPTFPSILHSCSCSRIASEIPCKSSSSIGIEAISSLEFRHIKSWWHVLFASDNWSWVTVLQRYTSLFGPHCLDMQVLVFTSQKHICTQVVCDSEWNSRNVTSNRHIHSDNSTYVKSMLRCNSQFPDLYVSVNFLQHFFGAATRPSQARPGARILHKQHMFHRRAFGPYQCVYLVVILLQGVYCIRPM